MTAHAIGTGEERHPAAALGAADWLCLAASPALAIMALFTGVVGGAPQDMLCAAAPHASPLNGMVWMYVLMSALHSAPWLKLIAGRPSRIHPVLIRRSAIGTIGIKARARRR